MKIYDENQFASKSSLGLEDNDSENNISLSKSCSFIKNIINYCIDLCEQYGEEDTDFEDCVKMSYEFSGKMINIKGIICNRGYVDIINYPEKKEILIDISIDDIKKCKKIVYTYLDATTSIYKTGGDHYKMFKARMEKFLKIDKTKGEEFTHNYHYVKKQETGVYSDTVWDEYKLTGLYLRIKKHYK